MNTYSPFLAVDSSCETASQWAKTQLLRTGLRIVQTFDLQAARHGLHDCSCPNHGTEACDCQMVVLLVYGKKEEPSTLILHGNNGRTWFSLVEDSSEKTNATTENTIRNSLKGNLPHTDKIPVSTSSTF